MNRNGDRPYSDKTLRGMLTRLAARLGVRDDAGRAGRLQPDPPLPAYHGHQPAQRRGPASTWSSGTSGT